MVGSYIAWLVGGLDGKDFNYGVRVAIFIYSLLPFKGPS